MMSKEEIDLFETLVGQTQSFYDEVQLLAKKSANDLINAFKLDLINNVLRRLSSFLGSKSPLEGFSQFDDETLPSNSDVGFVLSQYLASLEKLRSDNIEGDEYGSGWHWVGIASKAAAPPKKLK